MGRLFWKFFLFITLLQLAGIAGIGAVFWFENRPEVHQRHMPPPGEPDHPHAFGHPPHDFPRDAMRPPPHHEPGLAPRIPTVPLISALLVSLFCSFVLAWYFAKPIRRLRQAFEAAASGNLDVRIGDAMGRRDELADLGRDFDRMTERLGALLEGQKRLLHDVSHEMRSPLARLQAAIGLANQQPERLQDSLVRIERESERLNCLVDEVLTLSRLESGVEAPVESVDPIELLLGIVEDAKFEGEARNVDVRFEAAKLPDVEANAELLHRALENIVRNALRHSPQGGVVLLDAKLREDELVVSIRDQGPGVPERELATMFNLFVRGSGENGEGYGLGLAIAKRVILSLGGRIAASNPPGGGLLVEVSIPAGFPSNKKLQTSIPRFL